MNFFKIIFFSFSFIFYSEYSIIQAKDNDIFSLEEHCVAYSTPERILFFPDYQVIGKSCKIEAWAEKNDKKQSRFIVIVPIESIDSGISSRDADVMKILNADKFPDIRFETNWMLEDKIDKILLDNKGVVSGFLIFAGRKYLINLNITTIKKSSNYIIRAKFDTNYTFFNLTPPKLGFFAEVFNSIKIVVNLNSKKITGFER